MKEERRKGEGEGGLGWMVTRAIICVERAKANIYDEMHWINTFECQRKKKEIKLISSKKKKKKKKRINRKKKKVRKVGLDQTTFAIRTVMKNRTTRIYISRKEREINRRLHEKLNKFTEVKK